jgi:hypothetical protein
VVVEQEDACRHSFILLPRNTRGATLMLVR